MPILVGEVVSPPPTPTPPVEVRNPKRVIWTDPGGQDFDLSTSGYAQLRGRSGFGVVEREIVQDRMPGGAAMLHAIRDTPRTLSVPLVVRGSTQEEYLQRLGELQAAMRHRRGGRDVPGRLTVALPDGQRRSITAWYNNGLDLEEDFRDDLILRRGTFPNLEFLALEPYWEGEEIRGTWRQEDETATFFPILPVQLAPSEVLGSTSADNPGDADAYPVWEIDGPGTVTARNETSGQEWAFTTSIPTGTTVTVDTRPPEIASDTGLTAMAGDGTNWWPNFADYPELWALEPGTNELTLQVDDATMDTEVRMTAAVRHQAGW